jgi:transposase-like protein
MVAIIREADREPVAAVAKRHGVSEQAIYTWRKRFGGFEANDVRRLRQLEAENGPIERIEPRPHPISRSIQMDHAGAGAVNEQPADIRIAASC